jgi:hypothetical protein
MTTWELLVLLTAASATFVMWSYRRWRPDCSQCGQPMDHDDQRRMGPFLMHQHCLPDSAQ